MKSQNWNNPKKYFDLRKNPGESLGGFKKGDFYWKIIDK